MAGPSAVGAVADAFSGDLHIGIAFGLFFPVLMAVVLLEYSIRKRRKKSLLTAKIYSKAGSGLKKNAPPPVRAAGQNTASLHRI